MSILNTSSDGQILTMRLTEASILDESLIRQMYDDVIQTLSTAKERCLLMDFRCVQFLSSAALGTLLRIQKKCNERQISLRMSNIAPEILKVFRITKLDMVFKLHPEAEDALAAFRKDLPLLG